MKKIFLTLGLFVSLGAIAQAGPISSGGTNQILEECETSDRNVKLKVSVVGNDHLEAELVDSTALDSTLVSASVVYGTSDGYEGKNIKVDLTYLGPQKIATVILLSNDPKTEPRVYQNLNCTESLK